jgi:iron complex transport system ATP-binding protein
MKTNQLQLYIADRLLVDALDWQIGPGECWCVIGRNGAGKSTLLRTLVGLRPAESGTIELDGKPLADWRLEDLAKQRAFLPQGRSDAFAYRVIETVLTARHPYHQSAYWESDADYAAAHLALQLMDVDALADRDVRSLSGGERQRVAIAAVLAQDTPLLLLDEPTNALDLAHQVSVMRLLEKLCRDKHKSVVMVSHDLNLAHSVATHALLLMGDGRWHAGSVDDVMQAPLLSACLGHPIEIVKHGQRTIYLADDSQRKWAKIREE